MFQPRLVEGKSIIELRNDRVSFNSPSHSIYLLCLALKLKGECSIRERMNANSSKTRLRFDPFPEMVRFQHDFSDAKKAYDFSLPISRDLNTTYSTGKCDLVVMYKKVEHALLATKFHYSSVRHETTKQTSMQSFKYFTIIHGTLLIRIVLLVHHRREIICYSGQSIKHLRIFAVGHIHV